jgi:hypothetical protein
VFRLTPLIECFGGACLIFSESPPPTTGAPLNKSSNYSFSTDTSGVRYSPDQSLSHFRRPFRFSDHGLSD